MPDADLVVEVPVDAPPPPAPEPKHEPKPEPEVRTAPIEPLEDLRKQADELRAARENDRKAAEAARAEAAKHEADAKAAREEATKLRAERDESNVSAVDNAIAAAQAEAESAQREQQAAFEAGDFAKASEFGRKMAKAEARIVRLEEGKADLAERKAEPSRSVETRADPFEEAIAQAAPRAKAWLRAHPEFVTDRKLSLKAAAADNLALAEGLSRETDAYFDFCERQLGLKQEEPAPAPKPEPRQQARPMPGAPVSRDQTPSGGSSSPTQVTLTPGEQARATDGTIVWNWNDPNGKFKKGEPIGLVEMAKRKVSLQKQGAYDRSYTDQ